MSFPPIPIFPDALDTNFTLFKVFNSTQSSLLNDNNSFQDYIDIVAQDRLVWADNGFANLSGELIYYDGVDLDNLGRVIRLKRCLRGINGFSYFNPAGTPIYGFVVAEHHNQLALATILIEQFIGFNFTTDESTLDWRIRDLANQPPIPDDFSCPEVEFNFEVTNQSPATGTTISYSVIVNGNFGSAIVSFGDGSTTTSLNGTHTYSVNSKIDPTVTVVNGPCQIVQTPIERDEVSEPKAQSPIPPFTVPVPITPVFPSFIFPSTVFPSLDLLPPPFIDSCLDLSPLNALSNLSFGSFDLSAISIFIPSFDVNLFLSLEIPSGISLIVPEISFDFPSTISGDIVVSFPSIPVIEFGPLPPIPSIIEFTGAPTIPSQIAFVNNPTIPSQISITYSPGVSIPTQISVIYSSNIPTIISVIPPSSFPEITFGTAPMISVHWGTPPSITCSCVIVCPGSASMAVAGMRSMAGMDYEPLANDIAVEYDLAGLPSVISILAPERPITIQHDIPNVIKLHVPELRDIRILSPEKDIPSEIRILPPPKEEMQISLIVPKFIEFVATGLPPTIPVVFPDKMPMLSFDRSSFPDEIRVTGFPDSIKIEHNIPTKIEVDWSEAARSFSIPPVEVKPIEVKIDFVGASQRISDGSYGKCFHLVPCSPDN